MQTRQCTHKYSHTHTHTHINTRTHTPIAHTKFNKNVYRYRWNADMKNLLGRNVYCCELRTALTITFYIDPPTF